MNVNEGYANHLNGVDQNSFLAPSQDHNKSVPAPALVSGILEQLVITCTFREWIPINASLTSSDLLLQGRYGSKITAESISVVDIKDVIALQSSIESNASKLPDQTWNQRSLVRQSDDKPHGGWCFGVRIAGNCRGNVFRAPSSEARNEWVSNLRIASAAASRARAAEEHSKLSAIERARETAAFIQEHR
jgi:hypothetical protein